MPSCLQLNQSDKLEFSIELHNPPRGIIISTNENGQGICILKHPFGPIIVDRLEKEFTFEANDKIMFEANMIDKTFSMWRNDEYIGVLYEFDKPTAATEFTPHFYYWLKNKDENVNAVKHFKYCVKCPDLLNNDDKYGCNEKLLNVCSQLSSTKTHLHYIMKRQSDVDPKDDSRVQLFDPARMMKLLNEQCDANKMTDWDDILKQLDKEALPLIIDNLQKVQTGIDDFKKAREMKKNDPDYYCEWDINQVVDWIDSIENGKFSDYSAKIKTVMQQCNITAAEVKQFNPLSLKLMGIDDNDKVKREEFAKHCENFGRCNDKTDNDNICTVL